MKSDKKLLVLWVFLATINLAYAEDASLSNAPTLTKKAVKTKKPAPDASSTPVADPAPASTNTSAVVKPVQTPVAQPNVEVTTKPPIPQEESLFSLSSINWNEVSITAGFRVWANEWQAWDDPYSVTKAAGSFGTANAFALNPSLTIKYRDWFVSGGFMTPTNYSVPGSTSGDTISATRQEMDFSVGRYFHPQVALTFAYKRIAQSWGGTNYVWQIPAVGISSSAALQGTPMFMYANAAVGLSSISTSDDSAAYWGMKGGLYTTSEMGFGYSFSPKFRMTLGYKYQASPTSMESNLTTSRVNFMDYTRGFVLGSSYTF
jgi:hypothetical protein